ncbi:DUF1857 family protein [Paraburkholderia panacisoli]|uniref:DUF1857 family protein n=1 Tax=Paraburkholderia panacisoli TaxID=2603818 RepID=A0A5B0GNA9_9BURK|nr:SRPBCC family protein [Paraburkholderia panacisoli]KAA1004897.1 DUF1857 family protein [Paraburkholderia panacisoli]
MISVSRKLEVNPNDDSEPVHLNRQQVWEGLVGKAKNAVPFVAAITHCSIVEQHPDRLIREIVLHGETMREMILFFPEERVEFIRLSGKAKGQIKNILEEDGAGKLYLRFTFDLALDGVESGNAEEIEFANNMEAAYLDAVNTTLHRIREEAVAKAS